MKSSHSKYLSELTRVIGISLAFAACAELVTPLHAANGADGWTGATNTWNTAGNWTGANTPPISGDSLTFNASGAGGSTLIDNLTTGTSTWTIAGITFSATAPAYTINPSSSANGFTLTTGITNSGTKLQTINDSIALSGSDAFNLNSTGGITLGGVVSGTGTLTTATTGAVTSGTLTLSAADTYTGATTIGALTTLQLGAGGTTGSISTSSAISDSGTFAVDRSNAATQGTDFATVISGSGGFLQDGTGTTTLSGANTYTGTTAISNGALTLTGSLSSSSPLAFTGTGVLNYSKTGTNTQTFNGTSFNSGVGTIADTVSTDTLALGALTRTTGTGTTTPGAAMGAMADFVSTGKISTTTGNTNGILGPWAFTGTGTSLNYATVTSGTITSLTGSAATTSTALVATGNYKFTAGGTEATQTANTIQFADASAATLTESGTLTLNGIMNTGGALTITGGDLAAGSTGEIDIIGDASGITLDSGIVAGSSPTSLVYGGPQGSTGTLTLGTTSPGITGDTIINSGTLQVGDDTSVYLPTETTGATWYIANGATLLSNSTHGYTITADITGSGSLVFNDIIPVGTDDHLIEAVNSFTGTVTLDAYTNEAEFGVSGSFANATLVFNGSDIFQDADNSGVSAAFNGVTINSGYLGTLNNSAAGTNTFALGAITRNSNSMLALAQTGSGTITTTTGNTNGILGPWAYTGTGTALKYAVGATDGGTPTSITSYTQGTSETAGTFADVTSGTTNYYTATASDTNAIAITANTLRFGVTGNATWTNNGGAALNGLMNDGTGTLTESGTGTITSATAGGELDIITNTQAINIGSVIADNSSASSLDFASAGGTGTLTLTGANTYTGGTYIQYGTLQLGNGGSTGSLSATGGVTDNGTLVVNETGNVAQGAIFGTVSGIGGITQAGTGTLTLFGANTYTGTTAVTAGTLIFDNSFSLPTLSSANVVDPDILSVGNATLQLGDTSGTAYSVTVGGIYFTGANGYLTSGTGTATSTLILGQTNATQTLPEAIEVGAGDVANIGAGVTVNIANGGSIDGGGTASANGGVINLAGTMTSSTNGTVYVEGVQLNITGTYTEAGYLETQGVNTNTAISVVGGTVNLADLIPSNGNTGTTGYGIVVIGGEYTGAGATGAFTNTNAGGSMTVTGAVTFGRYDDTANAYVFLDSGTLTANEFYVALSKDSTADQQTAMYFNGGTLVSNASNTSFITGIGGETGDGTNFQGPQFESGEPGLIGEGGVYIGGTNGAGGAIINVGTYNDTVAQSLLTGYQIPGSTAYANTSGETDGGLTVEGTTGTLTLADANTYTGGTTIAGGTVLSGNSAALAGGPVAVGGGVLDIDHISQSVGTITLGQITVGGVTTTPGSGKIQSTGGTATLTGTSLTVYGAGNTIVGGTTGVIVNAPTTLDGALAVNGEISNTITISSTGTLTGTGTVTGAATLSGGIIDLGAGGNLGGTLLVSGGGNWNGVGSVTGLVTASSGTFNIGTGANLTAPGGVNVSGTGSLSSTDATGTVTGSLDYTSSSNSTFGGIIADGASPSTVTMNSSGVTLALTGSNTYSGGTTITAGTLAVAGYGTSLGTLGLGSLTMGGGILDLEGTSQTVTALNGTGTITNLNTDSLGYNSNLTVGSGNASGSYSGVIDDGNGGYTSLTKIGTGTEVLSGNSEYSNGTIINGGVLSISSESNIGNYDNYSANAGTPGVTLGGGELLTTATTPIVESVQLDTAATNTLAASTATMATYSGVISDATSPSGPGALTIGDSNGNNGAVEFTNNNTYSGGTTVNAGTLYADNASGTPAYAAPSTNGRTITAANSGSATGTGPVNVYSVLAGYGTIAPSAGNGVTVQSGGTLFSGGIQSGNTVTGTGLTLVNASTTSPILTTVGGSTLTFALSGTSSTGALAFSNPNTNSTYMTVAGNTAGEISFATTGTTTIDLVDLTTTSTNPGSLALRTQNPYLLIQAGSDSDYDLVTSTGYDTNGYVLGTASSSTSTQDLTAFSLEATSINGGTPNYQNMQLYLYNGDLEVVPEPSTWALMLGGLALLIAIQRRKNAKA